MVTVPDEANSICHFFSNILIYLYFADFDFFFSFLYVFILNCLFCLSVTIILADDFNSNFYFQNHIEKIVEKPVSQSSLHAPLSRRQSHNVNVEDIIAQQVGRLFFVLCGWTEQEIRTSFNYGADFSAKRENIREYLMRCEDAVSVLLLFIFFCAYFCWKGYILILGGLVYRFLWTDEIKIINFP